jgi:hypothetical protein
MPFAVVLASLLTPLGLWAQIGTSGSSMSAAGIPFGNGQSPSLSYAGQAAPSNMFITSLSSETTYDDNAAAVTGPRVGDVIYSLGPRFALAQSAGNLAAAIDYQPYFQFYQRLTQYDRVSQSLSADLSYKFGPRLTFRLRDSFQDQAGLYQPQPGIDWVPSLGAPTQLNTTIYSPLLTERDNNVRLDAIYQGSTRTSLTLFGDYDRAHFNTSTAKTALVSTTQSVTGGAQYAYRLSEHFTFAMVYMFQPMRFLGNLPAGGNSPITIQSGLFTIGWRVSPSVMVTAFGGPQYKELGASLANSTGPAGSAASPGTSGGTWSWAAGGTVSKQSERTAVVLSLSRAVSNGGAWLPAVTASTINLGLRRRLGRRWDGSCELSYAQNQYLASVFGGGRLDSETLSVGLGRPVSERATVRLSYNFIQQQGTSLPIAGENFGHNQVSLGIFYQLRKSPLGR